jgi:hypothetical protein
MSAAPPVIRHASSLLRDIELAVLRFPKRHQHVVGKELRQQIMQVAQLANRAWRRPTKRAAFVDSLVEAVDDLKLSMQLAKELHAFASFNQFEDLARKLNELGREVGGWYKQLHPQGQNVASRATPQSARTLSTSVASTVEANS